VCAAAQADLDDLANRVGSHASTLGREEDGYDGLSGAVAEWLGRGLQSLVQRFESARRLERSDGVGANRHSPNDPSKV